MPIRDGSPPAPARSRDDSEDEDSDEDHANGKRNAGDSSSSSSSSSSDPNNTTSNDAIPQMTGWAPAMFVPAKFDYTQPQQTEEQEKAQPPHQRLNDLLADLDAHAAAVRSNYAWMVAREARRVQQVTVQGEARILATGQPPRRSKRLAPSAGDEAALLRNMAKVPDELLLLQQQQRRANNLNTIPAFRRPSYDRTNSNNIVNNGAGAAATAVNPATASSRYEVSRTFSYREVSALPVDPRDTPREAAVTSILNVARNAMHTADWYSSVYQKRRNDKITGYVSEKARSFAQQDMGSGHDGMIKATSSVAATPASTSGGPTRRVSFGGLDGTDDPGNDGGDMSMDLD
ncbi:hypothetical protein PG994_001574 [Apiospora phragmitis]|uniref:Uncharacterized protein n=1 Tax=Apiospora phragmitis TaxID=2905665 RepID=A0ABR1WTZ4_9PEZI